MCVPYYSCPQNRVIIPDTIPNINSTFLNIKFDEVENEKCDGYLEQCCSLTGISPRQPKNPPIDVPQKVCGYRNPDGVGFKITGSRDSEADFG